MSNATKWVYNVHGKYSEPHRFYHGCEHINYCLKTFDEFIDEIGEDEFSEESRNAILMMIVYHDVVYDVGPDVVFAQNEKASKAYFDECPYRDRLSAYSEVIVGDAIIASAYHLNYQPHQPPEALLFLDIDLSSMGRSFEEFENNGLLIREEYSYVDEDTFHQNRISFFKKLLARPTIFYTHWGIAKFERRARANIEAWLSDAE